MFLQNLQQFLSEIILQELFTPRMFLVEILITLLLIFVLFKL